MEKRKNKPEQAIDHEKRERVMIVAERVKLLFSFCAEFIQDKDLLKEVLEKADMNVGRVMAMAPIIGAMGGNFEAAEFESRLRRQRAEALFHLIDTIDLTEQRRVEFNMKQENGRKGRAELSKILGGLGL